MSIQRLDKWRNRRREEEDDFSFPDEVDTPKEISARIRFQRFRGMRSFRTSPWDPFENLPRDYARIFQFEDFKRTERAVRRRAEQEIRVVQVCLQIYAPQKSLLIEFSLAPVSPFISKMYQRKQRSTQSFISFPYCSMNIK